MTNILTGILPIGFSDTKDFIPMDNTPFAYNALNLVFAPPTYGKSYATCNALIDTKNTVYLDFDFNSTSFKHHCEACNIEYANMGNVWTDLDNIKKVEKIFETLPENTVIVIDSLASILPNGLNVNDSTDMSNFLRDLNTIMLEASATIILIDHATKRFDSGKIIGFKVEGSETGKYKQCSVVVDYNPTNIKKPEMGGTMTVFKSRLDGVNVGAVYNIGLVATLKDAVLAVYTKFGTKSITASDFASFVKHPKDAWLKSFKSKLYKERKEGRTTYLDWNVGAFTMDAIKKQIKEK